MLGRESLGVDGEVAPADRALPDFVAVVTAYPSLIEPVNPLWCLLRLLDGIRS